MGYFLYETDINSSWEGPHIFYNKWQAKCIFVFPVIVQSLQMASGREVFGSFLIEWDLFVLNPQIFQWHYGHIIFSKTR